MNRFVEIHVDVFPVSLIVAIGNTKYLKGMLSESAFEIYEEIKRDNAGGVTETRNGCSVIIMPVFDNSPRSKAILSHEIFHAVNHQMEYIGIPLKGQSNEAYAYLIQYYTERFYLAIKSKAK